MKEYLLDIQWYDYAIYLIYLFLFSYLILRIGRVAFGLSSLTTRIMAAQFLLYCGVLIADIFLDFMPYMPDTKMYTTMIQTGLYPETSSVNVMALYYFSLVIAILCLNSPVIFTFFSIFFFLLGVQYLLSKLQNEDKVQLNKQQIIMAIMLLIWPAGLMYLSVPLREGYILLSMALFTGGLMSYLKDRKLGMLLTGAILLLLLRLQMFVCLAPLAVLLILLNRQVKPIFKLSSLVIAIIAVLAYLRYMVLGAAFSPEALADLRNIYIANGGNLAYGNVNWHSYTDMLLDLPFLVLQFILSPLPIFSSYNTSHMLLANADMIGIVCMLLIVLIDIRYHIKKHSVLLVLAMVFAIVFSLYEYHLSGAVRHRMPMVLISMIPVSATLARWTKNWKPI